MAKRMVAWVCLQCGRLQNGPSGHHVGGDDLCTNCPVGAAFGDEPGVSVQPRLARVEVEAADEGMRAHLWRARARSAHADEATRERLQRRHAAQVRPTSEARS